MIHGPLFALVRFKVGAFFGTKIGRSGRQRTVSTIRIGSNAVLLIHLWRIWDDQRKAVHVAATLDASFPPTFIAQAADDTASSASGNARIFLDLTSLKVPVEFHVYETGGHGFGMRRRAGAPGTGDWQNRAVDWLQLRGFIVP